MVSFIIIRKTFILKTDNRIKVYRSTKRNRLIYAWNCRFVRLKVEVPKVREVLDYRERLMIPKQKRLIDSGLGCERLGCWSSEADHELSQGIIISRCASSSLLSKLPQGPFEGSCQIFSSSIPSLQTPIYRTYSVVILSQQTVTHDLLNKKYLLNGNLFLFRRPNSYLISR